LQLTTSSFFFSPAPSSCFYSRGAALSG